MRIYKILSLIIAVTTMITACGSGSGGFSSVLDTSVGKDSTPPVECKISTSLPSTATIRMANIGGTQNFVVGGVDSTCTFVWKLNGTTLSGTDVAKAIT